MTTLYEFCVGFTKLGVGVAPSSAPTITVADSDDNVLVAGATATTALANLTGAYRYSYSGADGLICYAKFTTTDLTVDQYEIFTAALINPIIQDIHDTDLPTVKTDTAAILVDTGTTLPATLSTIEGKIDTVDGIVDNILIDTGTTLDGYITTVDTVVDAIKAKTDNLPTDPADESDIQAAIAAVDGKIDTIDTNVDAILVDTGTTLPATLSTIEGKIDTVDSNVDAILTDTGTTLEGKIDTIDGIVDDILTDTGTTLDGIVDAILVDTGTSIPAILTAIKGAGWSTETLVTIEAAIGSAGGGSGAISWTHNIKDNLGVNIPDVTVWVTNDIGGANILASGLTDASGNVTFNLDAGTVYMWCQKSGYNFTNPDTEVVS